MRTRLPHRLAPAAALLAALAVAGCGDDRAPAAGASGSRAPEPASEAQRAAAERLGVPPSFENDLGMRFVLVPPGTFLMGDESVARESSSEEPPHDVRIHGAFYLQSAEVTEGQLAAWRGATGRDVAARGVRHDDAVAFTEWLTARDPRWIYRLPTEAEWDYARHAGEAHPRPGAAEGWGLRGMDASPVEWCADWFAPLPSWQITNPLGPAEGTERVLRGAAPGAGSHIGRHHALPGTAPPDAGVRVAAKLSYGKADCGACEMTFRTVDPDVADPATRERPGYRVRLVAVIDRLSARQMGKDLPWVDLRGTSPVRIRIPPGRYYAIAVRLEGGDEVRGLEAKFEVESGPYAIDVPIPVPGAMLRKPQ